MRRLAIDGLDLDPGDTVVDMGCGPGVNFGYLDVAVGSTGTIVGLDVSRSMLEQARGVSEGDVALMLGDASDPPLRGPVDAVLATFVVTLFDEPEAVIETWWDVLEPGGRLGLVNLGPMRGLAGHLGNPLLRVGLGLSTPTSDAFEEDLIDVLDERVSRAHRALASRGRHVEYYDSADGLFRVAIATKASADDGGSSP